MARAYFPYEAIVEGMASGWGRALSIPLAATAAYYLGYVSRESAEWLNLEVAARSIWGVPLLLAVPFTSLVSAPGFVLLLCFAGDVIFLFWTEDYVLEGWFLLCLTDWAWYLAVGDLWITPSCEVQFWRVAILCVVLALVYGLLRFGPRLLERDEERH